MALKLGLKRLSRRAGTAAALLAPAALAILSGCTASGARECNVHADCASGVCNPDGTCAPVPAGGGGTGGAGLGGGGGTAGGAGGTGGSGTGGFGACSPNHDGVIWGDEIPLGPGYTAQFRISEDVSPFTTAPDCGTGTCIWDFVDVGGATREEQSGTEPIDGKWYAGTEGFEDATYVARMTDFRLGLAGITICDQTQYGVFQVTPDALLLLGLVSEFDSEGTLLVYHPPVPIMQYPLTVGKSWRVDTTATGPLCNSVFDYNIDQTYDSAVDAIGTVKTPYGDFEDVLRINTLVERHIGVGVVPTHARTHAFVAECFTSVANIVSPELVGEPEFDEAAEVRRLSVLP